MIGCVGIDPGIKCGWAMWDHTEQDFTAIKTLSFWDTIEAISLLRPMSMFTVYIEDPQQNKPVFARKGVHGPALSRVAQNVGSNKAYARLIIEFCERHGVQYKAVRPDSKSMTKMTAKQFQQMTGWMQRTSEHARDAAALVWGR